MKVKTMMIIKALVCLIFGPTLLLAPDFLADLNGISFGPGVQFFANLSGASMIGVLLLCWLAQEVDPSAVRTAITWDLVVYDAMGLIISLLYQLQGRMIALGWSIVAHYLFLTLGFGYFLISGPALERQRQTGQHLLTGQPAAISGYPGSTPEPVEGLVLENSSAAHPVSEMLTEGQMIERSVKNPVSGGHS